MIAQTKSLWFRANILSLIPSLCEALCVTIRSQLIKKNTLNSHYVINSKQLNGQCRSKYKWNKLNILRFKLRQWYYENSKFFHDALPYDALFEFCLYKWKKNIFSCFFRAIGFASISIIFLKKLTLRNLLWRVEPIFRIEFSSADEFILRLKQYFLVRWL